LSRRVDPPPATDLRESSRILANNRTRGSRSIVRKLLREGNLHRLPVYALVMQSDLGREGIINSGSYRFADHIYRNKPSGRGPFGRWIDALFLAMPATQAFHRRYKRCQDELRHVAAKIPAPAPICVLAIPCGIPRDLAEFCGGLDGDLKSRLRYYGMDLDPEPRGHTKPFRAGHTSGMCRLEKAAAGTPARRSRGAWLGESATPSPLKSRSPPRANCRAPRGPAARGAVPSQSCGEAETKVKKRGRPRERGREKEHGVAPSRRTFAAGCIILCFSTDRSRRPRARAPGEVWAKCGFSLGRSRSPPP
jgi:hypothetical protein